MTWQEARQQIEEHVVVGRDVNTAKSNGREVICVCDGGYVIPKGKDRYMFVTWDMLKICWKGVVANGGKYDIAVFAAHYPAEKKQSPCYVQTIHEIFKRAGLA